MRRHDSETTAERLTREADELRELYAEAADQPAPEPAATEAEEDDAGEWPEPEERKGCCMPDRCLSPDLEHTVAECFDREMAEDAARSFVESEDDDESSIFTRGDWLRLFAGLSLGGQRARPSAVVPEPTAEQAGERALADAKATLAALDRAEKEATE